MAGLSTSKTFPLQLDKTINNMFTNSYAELPKEYPLVTTPKTAPAGSDITEAEISGLGALKAMNEGESITFDVPAEGNKKARYYSEFGLGFQVTRVALEDELFGNLSKMSQALAKSATNTIETQVWGVFNGAFSSTTQVGWDGLAIIANNHATLKSGTTINNLGAADLMDSSLKAAFQYFDTLVDEAGLPILERPKILLVDPTQKWIANDLLKSTGRIWDFSNGTDQASTFNSARYNTGIVNAGTNGSPSNVAASAYPMSNWLNPSSGIVDGWKAVVSHYLTDTDNWFLLGDQFEFPIYWKRKVAMDSGTDPRTGSRLYMATTRFAAFINQYKHLYGGQGQ
jgi:hypothetical protein